MDNLTEGQKLRIARLVGNTTLSQLAEKLNLNIAHVSRMESNQRSVPDVLGGELIVQMMIAEYWYDQVCTAVREKFPQTADDVIGMLNVVLGINTTSNGKCKESKHGI